MSNSDKGILWKRLGIGILILFVIIQFFQIDRSNPEVTSEIPAPAEVGAILENSCYDCHSNETHWPWYSYIAPVSWLVGHDVHEAREHMNMSTWNAYSRDDQLHLIEEIWEEVEEGAMPLWYYTLVHQNAKLSTTEMQTLEEWANRADESEEEE